MTGTQVIRVSACAVWALVDTGSSLPVGGNVPRSWLANCPGRPLMVSLLLPVQPSFPSAPPSQGENWAPGSTLLPTQPCPALGTRRGAPHLVLLEVGLQGGLGLGWNLQDPQDPQQGQPCPQHVQSGHSPRAEQAAQAERQAGGAEATGETPIYGPGLASTQGTGTAHWRLVMLGAGQGS